MGFHRPTSLPTWLLPLLLSATLPVFVLAQLSQTTHTQGNYTSLEDAFWQLANLELEPTVLGKHMDPRKGGQNFTHCCLLAVNESLVWDNGYINETQPNFFLNSSIDALIDATNNNQFPCTAQWNGDPAGAPVVEVPASWLELNCPGWELSDSRKGDEQQWIQPFVGFLLPAVVFCKQNHSSLVAASTDFEKVSQSPEDGS